MIGDYEQLQCRPTPIMWEGGTKPPTFVSDAGNDTLQLTEFANRSEVQQSISDSFGPVSLALTEFNTGGPILQSVSDDTPTALLSLSPTNGFVNRVALTQTITDDANNNSSLTAFIQRPPVTRSITDDANNNLALTAFSIP